MHIAYFVSGWPLSARASGIVTYIDIMKRELELMGHEVSILCGEVTPEACDANVHKVEDERFGSLWDRLAERLSRTPERAVYAYGRSIAKAAASIHARKPIDVFEIEESFGWSRDLQALNAFPVVVRLHGPTFLVQGRLVGADVSVDHKVEREGAALKMTRIITAPSRCTLDETLARYALQPAVAQAIPNPYVVPETEPSGHSTKTAVKELLFVGRLDLVKGADWLRQTFALLAKRHPDLRLTFAGPDVGIPDADGQILKFAPYVQAHFDEDVRNRIQFLGQQTPDQIRALRARRTVTLVTSRWENQPYVALEAMAQRCPVVAFAAGGVGEVVQHERNGLSAPPGDVAELARQVERLLVDADLRDQLAEEGFRYVSDVHNPKRVAEAMLGIYQTAKTP